MPTAEQVTLNTAEYDSQSSKRLEELIRERGPEIAFSGLARFAFSASHLQSPDLRDVPDLTAFIEQFASTPLTVDFKKTRNSEDSRKYRLHSEGEIDYVAVCLYARTLRWRFLFCEARSLERHPEFQDRLSDHLVVVPPSWAKTLLDVKRSKHD